ncbi:MAG: GWxTD domain-containing protein [candidate division WOR-3 bacterium]
MRVKIILFVLFLLNIYLFSAFEDAIIISEINIDSTNIPYLNLNIEIPSKDIIFLKDSLGYYSKINIIFTFLKGNDNPILSKEIDTTIKYDTFPSSFDTLTIKFKNISLNLPEETKKLVINILDKKTDRSKNFIFKVEIPQIPQTGNYLKSFSIINGTNGSFFAGETIKMETNLIKRNEKNGNYNLLIIDQNERIVFKKKFTSKNLIDTLMVVKEFYGGKYRLKIEYIEDNKIINFLTKDLFIKFSFINSENEFQDILNALSYIAKWDELDKLKKSTKENREEEWNRFWIKQISEPVITTNISYAEFMDRYNYANKNFSGFKKGYRTDFGRIYIIYGKPDEIERHPFDKDSKPYEIWYYFKNNIQFIFVDVNGYGEYVLQNYLEQLR